MRKNNYIFTTICYYIIIFIYLISNLCTINAAQLNDLKIYIPGKTSIYTSEVQSITSFAIQFKHVENILSQNSLMRLYLPGFTSESNNNNINVTKLNG